MKAVKIVIIQILGICALLALAEGVCRLAGWGRPRVPETYIANWQQKFGGVFSVTGGSVQPPVNAEGFRDTDHAAGRSPGAARVAVIGDSVVYGYLVPFSDSLPQRLLAVLSEGGVPVEVLNFSRPGWSALQYRMAYERFARKYKADWVVVGCCLNDIPEMQNNLEKPPAWLVPLFRHSWLARATVRPDKVEIARVEELFTHPDRENIQNAYTLFFRELADLASEVEKDGARMAALLFPFRFQAEEPGPPPLPQEAMESFCKANGILYVDVATPLIRAGTGAFVDYDHLSPAGAEIAARAVAAALFAGPVRRAPGSEERP